MMQDKRSQDGSSRQLESENETVITQENHILNQYKCQSQKNENINVESTTSQ